MVRFGAPKMFCIEKETADLNVELIKVKQQLDHQRPAPRLLQKSTNQQPDQNTKAQTSKNYRNQQLDQNKNA